jgi:hypothetical protein
VRTVSAQGAPQVYLCEFGVGVETAVIGGTDSGNLPGQSPAHKVIGPHKCPLARFFDLLGIEVASQGNLGS